MLSSNLGFLNVFFPPQFSVQGPRQVSGQSDILEMFGWFSDVLEMVHCRSPRHKLATCCCSATTLNVFHTSPFCWVHCRWSTTLRKMGAPTECAAYSVEKNFEATF